MAMIGATDSACYQGIVRMLAGDTDDPPDDGAVNRREFSIPAVGILGEVVVPPRAKGLVAFAHGSGSSRFSPRNQSVAGALNERGFATLLLDLLRADEEQDRANVFDISLLSPRLVQATEWAHEQPDLAALPIGYFGASTGAAAALSAAAQLGEKIGAVVSRGGRPDLAGSLLRDVRAPTLLIVGGRDEIVLELNREALRQLGGPSELAVVPGATHLFEEAGALEEVSNLAGDWFEEHLGGGAARG
jgi:putative phosphoribosyl transferase